MSNDRLKKELPELLLFSIQNIIDGNHVDGKELYIESSEVYSFKLTIKIDWKFYSEWENEWIAGGEAASFHSGYDLKHFNKVHNDNIEDANNNKGRRINFISEYKNAGPRGFVNNNKKIIHNYTTHSYHYYCDTCDGRTKVSCSGCSGSGRKECDGCYGAGKIQESFTHYNNWNNSYEQRSRYVSCNRCGGSANITCYSCSGSGKKQCSTCSGHGYFTYYRSTSLVTEPSNYFSVNCQEYAQELVNYLADCNLNHLDKHINFTSLNYESVGQSYERFLYEGDSYVTNILTNLRSKSHRIVGYSNPPLPFIRSGIFDQLFIEEINALEEYQTVDKKIPKEKALDFFNNFSGQPVLERSLRGVAKVRKSTSEDNTALIKKECSYFITSESAKRLANGINAILDKVSPAYNGLVWTIAAIIYFIIAGIHVEYFTEIYGIPNKIELCSQLIVFLFFSFLYYFAYSIITFLLSIATCAYKSRNVPQEFRQKYRNKEPFFSTYFLGCLFIIIMAIYGYNASKTESIPMVGPKLLNLLFKSADYIFPETLVHKYCKNEYILDERRNNKYICQSKYFINKEKFNEELDRLNLNYWSNIAFKIQYILKKNDNPDIKIDGVIGLKTKEKIGKYFADRNMSYDENWSNKKILANMLIEEKGY